MGRKFPSFLHKFCVIKWHLDSYDNGRSLNTYNFLYVIYDYHYRNCANPRILIVNFFSKCEITNEGVRIQVLFFTRTIPFDDIKSIQRVSFLKVFFESINPFKPPMWSTGDMSLGGAVIIETLNNRRVAFSPKNCDQFIAEVNARIEQAKMPHAELSFTTLARDEKKTQLRG